MADAFQASFSPRLNLEREYTVKEVPKKGERVHGVLRHCILKRCIWLEIESGAPWRCNLDVVSHAGDKEQSVIAFQTRCHDVMSQATKFSFSFFMLNVNGCVP
ncbi:hypothetical protein M5K25_018307 [Dendrobium thyrsiflorum]|uniref:Uncharacterized protein n=1 Tax=Dendrobium thyrsiflorum TaxID=117978 RepID=A0ABD0UPU4_DENTH